MAFMKKESKEIIIENKSLLKSYLRSKWLIPFACVTFFIFILSLRLLSDPDLGFHLNTGRWIINNMSFPAKDTFTFTANQNDYIDLHWLFQIVSYILFSIFSYNGLSVFVALLSVLLLFFLLKRNSLLNIPLYISSILFFAGFIMIEPRIVLRPEMFTFIFITSLLFILDNYYYKKSKKLFLLPVVMLLWCNMHSLFILGFAIIGIYFISIYFKEKKLDKYFSIWMISAFLVCLINPYFIKGYTFPLELFSRFDSENIYHQHIREFMSFAHLDHFAANDILFIIFSIVAFLSALITIRKRKIHEILLLIIFLYLALISIRNIPLFVLVAIPVVGSSLNEIRDKITIKNIHWIKQLTFYLLIIIPLIFVFRIFTNSYYNSNNSYYKTGVGIDVYQQPEGASKFISNKNFKGNIINSIGFGGWLEWQTQQRVFIDGRLEVMKEGLYNKVVESWNNGISGMIDEYKPDMIVYNYLKYYTWTTQLTELHDWKLIYLDGVAAVFARKDISQNIPEVDLATLSEKYNISANTNDDEVSKILDSEVPSKYKNWLSGFYKNVDFKNKNLLNIASFCLQLKQYKTAEKLFVEVLRNTKGNEKYVYYALAEIYKSSGENEKANICFQKILKFDPENKIALASILPESIPAESKQVNVGDDNIKQAKMYFNSGNNNFQNDNVDAALKDYNKAIELNPDYYKAYNNRAILKSSKLKNDNEALKDFSKSIEINPNFADAYVGRGTSKYNLKDFEGACKDWNKAASMGSVQAQNQIEKYCK